MHWTATLWGPNNANGTVVRGNRAYVTDRGQTHKLWVMDVSDPHDPRWLAHIELPNAAWSLALGEDVLLIGSVDDQLIVVGIEEPDNPQVLSTVDLPDGLPSIVCRGQYAYVSSNLGIQILDLSTPPIPRLVGEFPSANRVTGIDFVGEYLCAVQPEQGLFVLDVSDVTAPRQVGAVHFLSGRMIAGWGAFAYVGTDEHAVQVVDVSDAANPRLLTHVPMGMRIHNILCADGLAAVVGFDAVRTFDLSDPRAPRHLGRMRAGYDFFRSGMDAGILVVPESGFGVHVAVLANRSTVPRLGGLEGDSTYWITAEGSYLWASDGLGVDVVNVSTPTAPYVVGSMPRIPGEVLMSSRDRLVSTGQGVGPSLILDLTDPTRPRAGAAVGGCAVALTGRRLFVASDVLRVYDLADVDVPQQIAALEIPAVKRVTVMDDRVYAANADGLWVADIRDLSNPRIIGHAPDVHLRRNFLVHDSYLFALGEFNFEIFDVSEPSRMRLLRTIYTPAPPREGIAIHGTHLYIAIDRGGLQAYDIAVPDRPRSMGHVDLPGTSFDLAMTASAIAVSDTDGGISLVPLACLRTATLLEDLDIESVEEGVLLRWRIDTIEPLDVRLEALAGDRRWEVPVVVESQGEYRAIDEAALTIAGSIVYTLMVRQGTGRWESIASRTFDVVDANAASWLAQPTPNPAAGPIEIRFGLGPGRSFDLSVFSVDGRRIMTLQKGRLEGRLGRAVWDGTNSRGEALPAGIYWLRLEAGTEVRSQKVLRLR